MEQLWIDKGIPFVAAAALGARATAPSNLDRRSSTLAPTTLSPQQVQGIRDYFHFTCKLVNCTGGLAGWLKCTLTGRGGLSGCRAHQIFLSFFLVGAGHTGFVF